ncbi:MAG TPA: STAS domain-containing protein [Hyphomicrobiales bacterium]|nr:STAS domain-containing protein [Hyphomicrobiales bacterium]
MKQTAPRKSTAKAARLALPARMETGSLGALVRKMRSHCKAQRSILVIDGGAVSVIDFAGVQLLVAFVAAMQRTGCALSWENYSVQVYQMASELGLAEQLGG